MESYKSHDISPFSSCAPTLAPFLIRLGLFLFSPRHQSLGERLSGIVIVIDD